MSRHAAARGCLARAAVLLLLAAPGAALAQGKLQPSAVTLKDGQVLRGFVVQPSETIIDPYSQAPVTIHKGLFLVHDYCRIFFFSHAYVDHAENRAFDFGRILDARRHQSFLEAKSVPPVRGVVKADKWNASWDRTYTFQTPEREMSLSQHLGILSPHFIKVETNAIDHVTKRNNSYNWSSSYRTREFDPETIVALLSSYRGPKGTDPLPATDEQRANRRFEIFNFLVQAGWLDAAQKELDHIKSDFPKEKEKIETAAEGIKKLVALDRLDEIKRAQAAGRHGAAQKLLTAFPADKADDLTQAEVRALKARYEAANTACKRAKSLLENLPKDVAATDEPTALKEAAAALTEEVGLDAFLKKTENEEGRLERFLTQADQADRFAKQNLPHLRPGELLSLAVTGWLLGPAAAETKPEAARRVWTARQFVREYQRTAGAAARAALLKDYEGKSPLGVAEMAQVISHLPPIDPPIKYTEAEVEMKIGPAAGKGPTYRLKLPPEYHPGRTFPVLIALCHGGESGKDMVKRWGDDAAKNGYILACPDWDQGAGGYTFTSAEQAVVLETLRDLRQHFNVDSDRVFLTGFGEGANMAWDVGLSHPDLFAGVVPIAGQPMYHSSTYWTNAMELPFYVVWGERMGGRGGKEEQPKTDGNLATYNLFKDHWLPGGFPAVGIMYKGRGVEWFSAEVPDVFEWMATKSRHNPLKVGFKDVVGEKGDVTEYHVDQRTMRLADNRFYWVTVDGISPRRLGDPKWSGNVKPAFVAAKIAAGNQIGVVRSGVEHMTLWLGRGMIDFDKPVTVNVNTGQKELRNLVVKPSLGVLLEDFFDRGDRQRLYLARIEVK
jgi:pimeloyl-ACP methyl ester carboxylesterase